MDGANLTTEVVYKRGQDYRFVCYDQGHACQSYRVRFLCGRPGKQLLVGDASATVALSLEPAAARCTCGRLGPLPASALWHGVGSPVAGSGRAPAVAGAGRAPHRPLISQAWSEETRVQWAEPPRPSGQRHAALCLFGCWIMLNPDPKMLVRRGWKWPVDRRGTGHLPKAAARDGRSPGGG